MIARTGTGCRAMKRLYRPLSCAQLARDTLAPQFKNCAPRCTRMRQGRWVSDAGCKENVFTKACCHSYTICAVLQLNIELASCWR